MNKYIAVFIMVLILWFCSPFIIFIISSITPDIINIEKSGQFGDSFGGINSLFSGLAFAVLIIAIFQQKEELSLQRQELSAQRKELKLTRQEIKNSATAQQEQVRILAMTAIMQNNEELINRGVSGAGNIVQEDSALKSYLCELINIEEIKNEMQPEE